MNLHPSSRVLSNVIRRELKAATAVIPCLALLAFGALASPTPVRADGPFGPRLAEAAIERTEHRVRYDGRYRAIPYPGGDVPDDLGVCTDLVIRAYRALGVDLQREVHEDMRAAFDAYPRRWGLARPDANIDHRRVPNLEAFLARRGAGLAPSDDPDDYLPGDLVTWRLPGDLPHIGIVTDRRAGDGARPWVVHNIGAGPRLEDMLFTYPITGHFRYAGGASGGRLGGS
ncbi:MAG: DUF1287 domain-containing protein [Myxococcales bacterium]|nr:DUF1287 domain-containing protein [Myxococcales bacterium]